MNIKELLLSYNKEDVCVVLNLYNIEFEKNCIKQHLKVTKKESILKLIDLCHNFNIYVYASNKRIYRVTRANIEPLLIDSSCLNIYFYNAFKEEPDYVLWI